MMSGDGEEGDGSGEECWEWGGSVGSGEECWEWGGRELGVGEECWEWGRECWEWGGSWVGGGRSVESGGSREEGRLRVRLAWSVHENNHDLELVDPALSNVNNEEALRIIAVALLCIQASPVLRPPLSRVVGMLSSDIEVGSVSSKSSFMTSDISGVSTRTIIANQDNVSPTVSLVVHNVCSPLAPQPMSHSFTPEGRRTTTIEGYCIQKPMSTY
ncbi:hypothetical protein H6P81_012817 [Aristolochia fimbriata]|uniref:Uncharacterized protein n=1 Tax=Aristolochia fimbriata TaxID=158543 RepID=A0AAV7ED96_ARIFI|nr:hypothetical protein H6P81_012817 [Aristolochia fimbriata]